MKKTFIKKYSILLLLACGAGFIFQLPFIWFSIFGGLSLDIQYNYAAYADKINIEGCASLFDYMQKFGNEAMMLKVSKPFHFQIF